MKYDLILGCGIGRCGTGFMSYFMFLNSRIAVWDGPGMGELADHVHDKNNLPLSDLHKVWGDDYQEPTHGVENHLREWAGSSDFTAYYVKRLTERQKNDAFFIAHNMGERHYPVYRNHFDCNIIAIYCAREIVSHYRSFKQWYGYEMTPEYFLDRIRGSLEQMDVILGDGVPIVSVNTPDSSMKDLRQRLQVVMSQIGIPMSKEQTLFLKRRRNLGAPFNDKGKTDAELLKELRGVKDFEELKRRYDALRTGKHEV